MPKKYFATTFAFDEDFLGLLEDSLYYNPQLSRDDKDALVTTLYEMFYEAHMPKSYQTYDMPKLEKPYSVPLAQEADELIPELWKFIHEFFENFEPCDECGGTSLDVLDACNKCGGTGIQIKSRGILLSELYFDARKILKEEQDGNP